MAKSKMHVGKKNGILTLSHLALDKLQRTLSLLSLHSQGHPSPGAKSGRRSAKVPKDVKEGHFAVVAVDDRYRKRFIVSLRYLNHPQFQKLLQQAAEEFGFEQEGALAIPCRPSELEKILGEQYWKEKRDHVTGGK